ncbi:MAG: hypothetical protein ACRDOH_24905 [Streptosporangiaceae bacterium]
MTATPGLQDRPPLGEPEIVQGARRHRGRLTLVVVLMVAGCAGATWWQVRRALDGNLLSDFYAFMWPVYGCYVIYLGLRLWRGATSLAGGGPRPEPVPQPAESDEELRVYNRYLAGKRAYVQRQGR